MTSNITNEIVLAYISELYKQKNSKLAELRDFATKNRVPIILEDTEGLLIALLKLKKPARLLEIGTAVGYSACVFADCCGCEVTTIEANPEVAEVAKANISELGFSDKIEVLLGDAQDVLEGLVREGKDKYDVVFIDAAKSHYREFWDLSEELLSEEGMIICDNVLMRARTASDEYDPRGRYKTSIKRMREFLAYISDLEDVDTCVLPVGDGVSISVF